MTRQKERACPCANTDKPNMDDFPPEYTMDTAQLQYAGILYYATATPIIELHTKRLVV